MKGLGRKVRTHGIKIRGQELRGSTVKGQGSRIANQLELEIENLDKELFLHSINKTDGIMVKETSNSKQQTPFINIKFHIVVAKYKSESPTK